MCVSVCMCIQVCGTAIATNEQQQQQHEHRPRVGPRRRITNLNSHPMPARSKRAGKE